MELGVTLDVQTLSTVTLPSCVENAIRTARLAQTQLRTAPLANRIVISLFFQSLSV